MHYRQKLKIWLKWTYYELELGVQVSPKLLLTRMTVTCMGTVWAVLLLRLCNTYACLPVFDLA